MSDPKAPHGRGADGVPLAPYGHNLDGTPRKSNRGRTASSKPKVGAAPKLTRTSNLTDMQRKGMLGELAMTYVVAPLATLSRVPFLKSRIGEKQTDAFAGDAFIVGQYAEPIIDGVIMMSKTRPGLLSWMDKLEENAPMLVLASAVLQAAKALAENHIRPNPAFANAGRNMAMMHMQQMADEINKQAEQMRAQTEATAARFAGPDFEPDQPQPGVVNGFVVDDPTVQFAAA
jgi:hypothetical protein